VPRRSQGASRRGEEVSRGKHSALQPQVVCSETPPYDWELVGEFPRAQRAWFSFRAHTLPGRVKSHEILLKVRMTSSTWKRSCACLSSGIASFGVHGGGVGIDKGLFLSCSDTASVGVHMRQCWYY
jgi:hypothetical protein